MSDLALARNCCLVECFPEKPSWCRNEQVCQGRQKVSVKRFERSNGLDTALHKKYLYLNQDKTYTLENVTLIKIRRSLWHTYKLQLGWFEIFILLAWRHAS